ncbi:hypothetical protein SOVF_168490 [Spinacia oleracea]|nr:hypothetical protein SOVF_168490 [Spinacia oleracea]
MANMGGGLLMTAKLQGNLGLQKNKVLLSQLSAFQFLLDDFYGSCRPSIDDYANRRDLIRIFNEITREMYGNSDECPVVENFGSFLMDMFSAKSDLDLSINFSDQLFEADRIAKIKTLRKFAKKFYALRKKGHITTVELIMSARVPVLKVTDSGSGIECDFSVGNRDGIAKSQIVLLISAIDERFQKLSFILKAWAKKQDINSSKDGTLNSISLILLAAFHLQTREIPILPPFSAIFKGGTDPATVKKIIPSFLNYGKRNKESLAELFVSLLVKLESVESLWSRGLCASTYEGTWINKSWTAAGHIRIEDFTDRSENTARAVKSANMNKIYSCIRRSLEQIKLFSEGKMNADMLKNLLFGKILPQTKKIANVGDSKLSKPSSENPAQKKKKRPTQGVPAEGKRPEKQGKGSHNSSGTKIPTPSGKGGVKKKSGKRRKSDPVTSTCFQGLDKSHETQIGSCQPLPLLPIQRVHTEALNNATQRTRVDTLSHARQPLPYSNPPYVQGSGGFGPDRIHVETLRHAALNCSPHQSVHFSGYGRLRPERNHVETMKYATAPNFPQDQPLSHSNHHIQGYGGFRSDRTQVETLGRAPNFPESPQFSVPNPPVQGFARYAPERMHVETPSYSASRSQQLPYAAGFGPERSHAETIYHATPSFQTSVPYTSVYRPSISAMAPHQPHIPTVPLTNHAGYQRPHDTRQSFSHVPYQFAVNNRPYQP